MSFLITARYQKSYELRKKFLKALKDGDPEFLKALDAFETELIKLSQEGPLKTPFLRFIFGKE
jgi:hypothetical protein